MGFMTEKIEKEQVQQEQAEASKTAVTAAIGPLQREITSLKGELRELKKAAERSKTAVIDDNTRREIRGILSGVDQGFKSYNIMLYLLIGTMVFFGVFSIWTNYNIRETNKELNWKYDVVTSILSGDRHYWWDGENYEASRVAPEAKRLQGALDHYQKISEQMKKQANK